MNLKMLTDPRSLPWQRRPLLFARSLSLDGGSSLHAWVCAAPPSPLLWVPLARRSQSRPGLPSSWGCHRRHRSAGRSRDGMILIGGSYQPDSFSAKLRWVGRVRSWHCSPFRALFSVWNSPRNRRKSRGSLCRMVDMDFRESLFYALGWIAL